MGAIREVDWRLRAQEVSRAYREATEIPSRGGAERSVLVVAATHDEIKSVTHAIRQDRKRAGELTRGETVIQHVALNWTEAQKKQTKNYHLGQVLTFHKATKGIQRNESLEVLSADRNGVTLCKPNGENVTVSTREAKHYSVFKKQELEVSAGDKLLLEANWRDTNFRAMNGELVTVARVVEGRIHLADGRELPSEYQQFTHGYAVTAHRSQGKTVDFEILAADRMARDLFYVSATRAREGLIVITSDKGLLQESIAQSGDRQSATELARRSALAAAIPCIANEDLLQVYEAQQQLQQRSTQREQTIQREITRNVNDHYAGISLCF